VDGVSNFTTDTKNHCVTVSFDEEKTDVSAIKKALADGGFPVKGEAQFLK
jgi:copper chaperone CopZ